MLPLSHRQSAGGVHAAHPSLQSGQRLPSLGRKLTGKRDRYTSVNGWCSRHAVRIHFALAHPDQRDGKLAASPERPSGALASFRRPSLLPAKGGWLVGRSYARGRKIPKLLV